MDIVTVTGIAKSYDKGSVHALKGVSFAARQGEIFGIIGPDGAGKTTLFRILATLLLPDAGTATVDGHDIVSGYREIRKNIGYMPARFSLYQDMTVRENLEFFATVFDTTIERNYHLIKDIYEQIAPFSDRRAGNLSGGMKQKLALSCSLIHAPRVLLLDEPTTGVDPVSRKEFWEMLRRLKENFNITIIVSTPYMDEATRCDRIGLIQNGQFLKIDTPAGIVAGYRATLWAVRSDKMHDLLGQLRHIKGIITAYAFGDVHHVTVDPEVITVESLRHHLEELGHHDIIIRSITPTIEDCFMDLQEL